MSKRTKQKKLKNQARRMRGAPRPSTVSDSLNASELRALEAIDEQLAAKAQKGQPGARRVRAKAAADCRQIGERAEARAEQRAVQSGIAERVQLEAARGGQAEMDRSGGLRIKGRDGLYSLHRTGTLKASPYAAGVAFRACYEAQTHSLRTARYTDDPRGSTSGAAMAAALQQTYMLMRLAQFERAVTQADPTGRALAVVQAIAGRGETLGSLGDSGAAKKANTKALKDGLDAILDAWPKRPTVKPLRIGAG